MAVNNNSFSGTGYDRWAYEQSSHSAGSNDTALNKLQHKFWITKQKVVRKLGKEEDEHVAASDSELDAKLELFRSISETTSDLQRMIEHYQDRLCNLAFEENCLGRFLKEYGKADKTKAGKMMVAVGKTMGYSGQQRLSIRVPLVRLYQEVETFRQRAIEDTLMTVERMEKSRNEYRGALLWMKNVSQDMDPDTYKQLEKFRKVQGHVKMSKARFDKLKLDCLQKVDLLAASRCNMFSHALILYQNALITFWEKTARTMNHVNNSFKGYQHYEFNYIKDLAEPSRALAENEKNKLKKIEDGKEEEEGEKKVDDKQRKDDLFFFHSDYTDKEKESSNKNKTSNDPNAGADNGSGLLDITNPLNNSNRFNDDQLLNFGDEEEEEEPGDDQNMEGLPMLTPAAPFPKPSNQDDALLLEELMNGPASGGGGYGQDEVLKHTSSQPSSGNFSDQWNQLFGTDQSGASVSKQGANEDDFNQFMSARAQSTAQPDDLMKAVPKSTSSFLPSQLFDNDQSFHSSGTNRLGDEDLLKDFPMPSPARPSSVQKKLNEKKKKKDEDKDMSQWFSLFADLDPLANPDAIGKTTKQEDKNCYS